MPVGSAYDTRPISSRSLAMELDIRGCANELSLAPQWADMARMKDTVEESSSTAGINIFDFGGGGELLEKSSITLTILKVLCFLVTDLC